MKEHQQGARSPAAQSHYAETFGGSDLPAHPTALTEDNVIQGFKEFISRGNVVGLAVGVIIGAAFKDIVDALIDDIINPFTAAVIGEPDFSDTFILTLNGTDVKFGVLTSAVINFLLMAITLYLYITVPMNTPNERMKKQAVADKAEAEANKEENDEVKLLTEIRDALTQDTPRR